MNLNAAAALGLLADLYAQVQAQQERIAELDAQARAQQERIAELEGGPPRDAPAER